MTKKRKIILISLAVTLALAVGLGGLAHAIWFEPYFDHANVGGNKLLGVGEMGWDTYSVGGIHPVSTINGGFDQDQWWDTQFIITNPNCDRYLTIEWVALIAGETNDPWTKEQVIAEGKPEDWPGFLEMPDELSPHEVWQVSVAELVGAVMDEDPEWVMDNYDLNKYTLEVTWSGARYVGWWWWGYWRSGRPLTGWQKEKCWYVNYYADYNNGVYGVPDGPIGYDLVVNNTHIYSDSGMAISEAEMKVFPSRTPFKPGVPYFVPLQPV